MQFPAYLFIPSCTSTLLVPVPGHSQGRVRTSYVLDDLDIDWWFDPGSRQTKNTTLHIRDYLPSTAPYADEVLDMSFHVFSFKQWPIPDLPRNALLDHLTDNDAHHYGRILVVKLDRQGLVHGMEQSDYDLLEAVVFR